MGCAGLWGLKRDGKGLYSKGTKAEQEVGPGLSRFTRPAVAGSWRRLPRARSSAPTWTGYLQSVRRLGSHRLCKYLTGGQPALEFLPQFHTRRQVYEKQREFGFDSSSSRSCTSYIHSKSRLGHLELRLATLSDLIWCRSHAVLLNL